MVMAFGQFGWSRAVDDAEGEGGVAKAINPVGGSGAQGDVETGEGTSDVVEAVAEGDFTFAFYGANQFIVVILSDRQMRGHGAGAGLVAGRGHGQVEGFMGAVMVVETTVGVEAFLRLKQVGPVVTG